MSTGSTGQAAHPDVVVVGGGIGGLSSAYALATAGRRVRVLEQSPTFAEVGAGLQLGPNATRILREWGLLDEVVSAGVLPRRLVLKDALDGSELTHLDLGQGFLDRYGAPYVVIHRSDLLDILYRACERAGIEMVTNARVLRVDTGPESAAAITGDAAHPMLQYLAQGACQAIEDAWTLAAQAPSRGCDGPDEWQQALASYEKLRTERTAQVQLTARAWGDLWHCDGLTRALRNELLRDRDPADYKHIDWLYSPAVAGGVVSLPV